MGRYWQSLLLSKWKDIFARIPIESAIKETQAKYYQALNETTAKLDSGIFVEYILAAITNSLKDYQENAQDNAPVSVQDNPNIIRIVEILGNRTLSMTELMEKAGMKHRQNFRKNWINPALEAGLIEMTIPDKANSKNQKYRRKGK